MLNNFLKSFKSVVLSTIDENDFPFTSYAPYIKVHNKYYFYLSNMAKHSHNLKKTQKVSLFFIEDEQKTENIFARKRVVFQARVEVISKDILLYKEVLDKFEKLDNTIATLRKMSDFNLYEAEIFYGEAVFGFGKAYEIKGKNFDELIAKKATGHK
ncbi:HugZ family protein [Malaciobacter mytili]|uniref:HugZ family pyridoxamine 5'-phosphate oxidase n=1 Tax=Malaciobacter mytili TaxID=603050 RepID=UPI003A8686AB